MDRDEALAIVRPMFASNNRPAADLTLSEYAQAIVESPCESCAVIVVERIRTQGSMDEDGKPARFPTAPEIRSAIQRSQLSAGHANHIGHTHAEERVGQVEAFWHRDAAGMLRGVAGDHDEALFLAGSLWWTGVPARRDWVEAELEDPGFVDTFVTPTLEWGRQFTGATGITMRQLADRTFTRSRRAHLEGEANLPADVVDLKVGV